jgi:NRPS condensation-like uncharacterized protein
VPRFIRAAPKDHFFQRFRGTGVGLGSDQQIRLVLRYGGLLDLALLQGAIRSVVDEEPILRARFVEPRTFEGRWELRDDDDEDIVPACELEEVPEPEPAVAGFLADLEVRAGGPYLRLRVIRAGGRDTLCLRVDHRLCDGAGTRLLAARLTDRYRRLAAGLPLPPCREALGPRTLAALTGLGPPPLAADLPAPVQLSYALPQHGFTNERPAHAVRVIDAATTAALRQASKPVRATLTDAMVVALTRALHPFSLVPPGSLVAVMVTTDVRNRLPADTPEVLGNLFQGYFPELGCDPAEPFRSALAAAARAMGRVRAGLTLEDALRDDAELEKHQRLVAADPDAHLLRLQQRATTFVVLSNVGPLDADPLDLGTPPLLDAQLLGTVALGRELLLCASSFRGALTLSIGYCASDVDPSVVEGVLDRTVAELTEYARASG